MPPNPYAHAPRLPELSPEAALDLRTLLPGTGPLELEVGPGRGGFIFERLAAAPVRVIGFEVRRKWATIVDARLAAAGLAARGRVFAEDIRVVLPALQSATVDAVYVHFPDPWWKKRHQKRLVVQGGFIEEVARVLRPGGELFVQTDVEDRALAYEELVARCPELEPLGQSPRTAENPYGARSPREKRAEADGLPVYRMRWRRAG